MEIKVRIGRALVISVVFATVAAGQLPKLRGSDDHRYLVNDSGKPFFYLADTGWELFHRLTRDEAVQYLDRRKAQGFTVIQAVALAEFDGLTEPNAYGALPLVGKDPNRPAITGSKYSYWDHVDYIVDQANQRGLYIAMLPTWARYVAKVNQDDDQIFNPENAAHYGEFLGKRYGAKGVIWILGGDRTADGVQDVWRAMAAGIAKGAGGTPLMSFHPRGGATSSTWFHDDGWLSFNMQQTGHGKAEDTVAWAKIRADYNRAPVKPVIDGEPLYEDHPLAFNSKENGYSNDTNVRQRAYWDLFSGACGHTYGNHAIWQFYAAGRKPVNGPLMYWQTAILRPGAEEMRYVRRLMESRPTPGRVPGEGLIAEPLTGADHISATRGDGYLFVYSGSGRRFTLQLGRISGTRVHAWWYNPRSGDVMDAGTFENTGTRLVIPPSEGFGSDWVFGMDDVSKGYALPGVAPLLN